MEANMSRILLAAAGFATLVATNVAQATVIATFDDLPGPPAIDKAKGLQFSNNNSLLYKGITWDGNFTVVGDQYRVDTVTPGPFFGQAHSSDYYVTNGGGNEGLLITTNMVLTGAWFGPNEYYGFGRGADQITIVALSGVTELASIVHNLSTQSQCRPRPMPSNSSVRARSSH